jgi:hypothetical protein
MPRLAAITAKARKLVPVLTKAARRNAAGSALRTGSASAQCQRYGRVEQEVEADIEKPATIGRAGEPGNCTVEPVAQARDNNQQSTPPRRMQGDRTSCAPTRHETRHAEGICRNARAHEEACQTLQQGRDQRLSGTVNHSDEARGDKGASASEKSRGHLLSSAQVHQKLLRAPHIGSPGTTTQQIQHGTGHQPPSASNSAMTRRIVSCSR